MEKGEWRRGMERWEIGEGEWRRENWRRGMEKGEWREEDMERAITSVSVYNRNGAKRSGANTFINTHTYTTS
jgi:hypothetical protein